MSDVEGYENYLGAIVVNDCPACDSSHFLAEEELTPSDSGGEYVCGDQVIEVHIFP